MSADVLQVTAAPGALTLELAAGDGWLWLLTPGLRPLPDALDRLVEAVEPPDGAPAVLVAGRIEDAAGAPLASELPSGDPRDDDAVIRLAAVRVLPIRSAPLAHCLVRRRALAEHGLPDERRFGPYAGREWSARVLASAPGYLAAASVAVRDHPAGTAGGRASLRTLPAALRMSRTDAWTRGESAAALADLARSALKSRR